MNYGDVVVAPFDPAQKFTVTCSVYSFCAHKVRFPQCPPNDRCNIITPTDKGLLAVER